MTYQAFSNEDGTWSVWNIVRNRWVCTVDTKAEAVRLVGIYNKKKE